MLYVTNIDDPSVGYTYAALNYAMALKAGGVSPRMVSLMTGIHWPSMPAWCQPLADRPPPEEGFDDLALLHHTPDNIIQPQMKRGRKYNVGLTVVETDCVPSWLGAELSKLDAVIVPSWWQRQVFRESGVLERVPLIVAPHAMGPWWWEPMVGDDNPRPLTFYYVGNWTRRKNPRAVVQAYVRAFPKPTGETRLLLKLSRSSSMKVLLPPLLEEEGQSPDRLDQDIQVIAENWKESTVRWFHGQGDVYVSLHRGEGWGYGLFQAALLGKPVIYTNWSAPTEFLHQEFGDFPITYKMTPVTDNEQEIPYLVATGNRQLQRAEPSVDHAVEVMRQIAKAGRPTRDPECVAGQRLEYSWNGVGAELVRDLKTVFPGVRL